MSGVNGAESKHSKSAGSQGRLGCLWGSSCCGQNQCCASILGRGKYSSLPRLASTDDMTGLTAVLTDGDITYGVNLEVVGCWRFRYAYVEKPAVGSPHEQCGPLPRSRSYQT